MCINSYQKKVDSNCNYGKRVFLLNFAMKVIAFDTQAFYAKAFNLLR